MSKATTAQELATATQNDPRWHSVVEREGAADGKFFYSVKTTGVYCRPSCGARLARPENVQFYSTPEEAEKAGFRPCKRCKPKRIGSATENAAKIAKACRQIERSEKTLPLKKLADSVAKLGKPPVSCSRNLSAVSSRKTLLTAGDHV